MDETEGINWPDYPTEGLSPMDRAVIDAMAGRRTFPRKKEESTVPPVSAEVYARWF